MAIFPRENRPDSILSVVKLYLNADRRATRVTQTLATSCSEPRPLQPNPVFTESYARSVLPCKQPVNHNLGNAYETSYPKLAHRDDDAGGVGDTGGRGWRGEITRGGFEMGRTKHQSRSTALGSMVRGRFRTGVADRVHIHPPEMPIPDHHL